MDEKTIKEGLTCLLCGHVDVGEEDYPVEPIDWAEVIYLDDHTCHICEEEVNVNIIESFTCWRCGMCDGLHLTHNKCR